MDLVHHRQYHRHNHHHHYHRVLRKSGQPRTGVWDWKEKHRTLEFVQRLLRKMKMPVCACTGWFG